MAKGNGESFQRTLEDWFECLLTSKTQEIRKQEKLQKINNQ